MQCFTVQSCSLQSLQLRMQGVKKRRNKPGNLFANGVEL